MLLIVGVSGIDEGSQERSSSVVPMPELGPDDTKRGQIITPSGAMAGVAGTDIPLYEALEETTGSPGALA